LVEILVVVTIIGICAAIIVPQIGSRDDLRAAAAARVVMADIMFAQNRAIATQSYRFVTFAPASSQYSLLEKLSPLTYTTNPVTKSNWTVTFGTPTSGGLSNAHLTSASFDGGLVLAFDSLGAPYSIDSVTNQPVALTSAGTVVVDSASLQNPITISIEPDTGEVSAQ